MKNIVAGVLKKQVPLDESEIYNLIEIPPAPEMGDYAFPCFSLAKIYKKNPNQIALELKDKLKLPKEIESVKVEGAYLNFFVDKNILVKNIIGEILKKKDNFGKLKLKSKKVLIEFPSPNTNKPLHLGHLRNMAIGESVSRILEFNNMKLTRVNLNNDRGIHICKSMLAYKKFGKNKKPNKKSDHFVGDFYVLFSQKSKIDKNLEEQAQDMLKKWEDGDKETVLLWKKMNNWALTGFKETYKLFGININKEYYESQLYKKGKEIILDGLKKGIFEKRNDNAVIMKLEEGEKVLLRPDGTSIYITQDLYLAKLKDQQYHPDLSIYVTGNEQNYHFDVLFSIIKKLNFPFAEKLKHLSYGMVFLPEGKMKSREGKVVDADDLIKEVSELVKKELISRHKLSKIELEKRSLKIALAAIKYYLLKVDSNKSIIFNSEESINFEGDTGPYLQYSYARASSILKKAKPKNKSTEIKKLEPKEIELVKKLSEFQEIVLKSYGNLNPSSVANYSCQLAQTFNEFYHECSVINSENENFRISLVKSFRIVLKNSLYLLGIDVLDEM